MGKTFKYKDFVNKLRFQVGGVCPDEFGEYGEKYIKGFVYSQSLKAAETLHQESSISNEACEVITQAIAEWTYHKIIDLMNGDVPEIFHERILKKVNETIYDFLIDENRQRPLTYETFHEPDVRDVLEMLIKDTYRDALAQLYSDKGICKDVYTWALSQSHCDDKPDDENSTSFRKEDVFISNSIKRVPYLDIFLVTPFLLLAYLGAIIINLFVMVDSSNKNPIQDYIIFAILILLICGLVRRVILNYSILNNKELDELEEQIEDWRESANPNSMYQRLGVDVLSLQVGFGLIPLADPSQRNKLLPAVAALRKNLTDSLGYIIPNIRVMDSNKLKPNECVISIRGNVRSRFLVDVKASNKEEIIVEEIKKACIKYVNDIYSKTDVLKLMELVRSQDPTLVNDLVPDLISAIDLRRIIVNLLREQVSIKDVILIFERLCDFARFNHQPTVLTERLRSEMGASICLQHALEVKDELQPVLYVITLSNSLEDILENAVQTTELGVMFMLDPVQIEKLVESVASTFLNLKEHRDDVVLIVTPKIRAALFGLLSRHFEDIKVMSYSELITDLKVEKLGEIE